MRNRLMHSIKIELQPSYLLLGLLVSFSILACASVIIVGIPFGIKLCLLAIIIFACVYYTLRDALQAFPWSWRLVEVDTTGALRLTNQRGQQFTPALHNSTFIHPWLIILNVSNNDRGKWYQLVLNPVLVFPNIKEAHRQLRVWLKWWPHSGEEINNNLV